MSDAVSPEPQEKLIKAVVFDIRLDTYFPLPEQPIVYVTNQHSIKPVQVSWLCKHFNSEELRKAAFEIPMSASVHPPPPTRTHLAAPVSDVRLAYEFATPVASASLDEFFGSPIWRFSFTGCDLVVRELNRIIDLYRLGNFPAFLTDYVSSFNFVQFVHFEIDENNQQINQSVATGKAIHMGGEMPHVDPSMVSSRLTVFFHNRLYMSARKAFAESRFLDMQVEVSNAVEAASKAILEAANRIAAKPLSAANIEKLDYRGRFGHAMRLLHHEGFSFSTPVKVSDLREICMEHRNAVMHGDEKALTRAQAQKVIEAANDLMLCVRDALTFVLARVG